MNGNLISRSALLEEMRKFVGNQRYLISEEVWNMVENAPAAYDVDKVMERLEESKYEDELYPCNLAVEIEEAKRIVKSGGIV